MTEKEFLLDAFWAVTQVKANGSYEEWREQQSIHIDKWLEYVHQTYYEVEFIKKDIGGEFYGIPWIFDPVLTENDIYFVRGNKMLGKLIVGVDPAKPEKDETVYLITEEDFKRIEKKYEENK